MTSHFAIAQSRTQQQQEKQMQKKQMQKKTARPFLKTACPPLMTACPPLGRLQISLLVGLNATSLGV